MGPGAGGFERKRGKGKIYLEDIWVYLGVWVGGFGLFILRSVGFTWFGEVWFVYLGRLV